MSHKDFNQIEETLAEVDAEMDDSRPPNPDRWTAQAVRASEITAVPISWLWFDWIARGKLTIQAGAAGSGKTTLVISLAATVTQAGTWPDGSRCAQPGNVIIWSSEDDPADTLIPRLMAAGADLQRVYILKGRVNELGETAPFDPAGDIGLLAEQIATIGDVHLLMIDPLVSAVRGDMHKANDVRRGLQAMVDLAERYRIAVVGISHFSKGSGGSSPADRVIGSQAFAALARTVLVAAKSENDDVRVLARAKSNIGLDSGGVSYMIEPCTVGEDIDTTRVSWGGRIDGTAREILADAEYVPGDEDQDDPVEALRQILRDGPMDAKEAAQVMARNGFTAKQVRRAREKLDVTIERKGFGSDLVSEWSLPSVLPPGASFAQKGQFCPPSGVGKTGEEGQNCGGGGQFEPPDLPDVEGF